MFDFEFRNIFRKLSSMPVFDRGDHLGGRRVDKREVIVPRKGKKSINGRYGLLGWAGSNSE